MEKPEYMTQDEWEASLRRAHNRIEDGVDNPSLIQERVSTVAAGLIIGAFAVLLVAVVIKLVMMMFGLG